MGIRIDCICDGCGLVALATVKATGDIHASHTLGTVEIEETLDIPEGWVVGTAGPAGGHATVLQCAECWGKRAGIETEAERLRSEVSRLTRENVEMVKLKADHEALRRAAAAVIGSPAELIRLFDERNIPKPPES